MKSAETKTATFTHSLLAKAEEQQPFFQMKRAHGAFEEGNTTFFIADNSQTIQRKPFFSKPARQPKIAIGQQETKHDQEDNSTTNRAMITPALAAVDQRPYIQRIPKNPNAVPFDGEITASIAPAALRSSPVKNQEKPYDNIIADLPQGHPVRVLGGKEWIFVKTHINNQDRVGYVSHELIEEGPHSGTSSFETDKGNPISVGGSAGVPPLSFEKKWMKDQGLAGKVRRIPNSATSNYNCHGFVYLDAGAWLNDPTPIISDNEYFVPLKPNVDDAVVYTMIKPELDENRRPIFANVPPHSGLVTKGSPGRPTEVTSKWGSWHVYQHKPADVWTEYGIPTFLRSKRPGGHTVKTE